MPVILTGGNILMYSSHGLMSLLVVVAWEMAVYHSSFLIYPPGGENHHAFRDMPPED